MTLRQQTRPLAFQRADEIRAWLYGYVVTSVPGHREVQLGDYIVRVPAGTWRWDAFIGQLDAALGSIGWSAATSVSPSLGPEGGGGRVVLTGTKMALSFPDRLGALLGFGLAPQYAANEYAAPWLPLGGVPLYSATWQEVNLDREVRMRRDSTGRGLGYAWGGARLWSTRLRMSRQAVEVLTSGPGWLCGGRVAIVPVGHDWPMGGGDLDGALDGYIVSVGQPKWDGPLELIADVPVVLATDATSQ